MNKTFNSSFVDLQDTLATSIQIGILLLIFFVALIGNSVVIIILMMNKFSNNHFKMNRISFYIAHLSLADIVVALFSIFPQVFEIIFKFFKYSQLACKFIKFGQVFSVYGSTMALILMAYDRYTIVNKTDKVWNREKGFYQITFAWSISFILSFPQLFVFSVVKYPEWDKSICAVRWQNKVQETSYILYHFAFQYLVPSMVLVYYYAKIFMIIAKYSGEKREEKKLMKQDAVFNIRKSDLNLNESDKEEFDRCNKWYKNTLTKSKVDTLILTFAIVVTFIICGLPFYLSLLVYLFYPSIVFSKAKYFLLVMSLLFQLNSCANPIIYLIFNRKIYKYFKSPKKEAINDGLFPDELSC